MKKSKKIHFVGIKGVGQAALAIIAKEAGFKVTGSDVGEVFITDEPLKKAGIIPFIGFSENHVAEGLDLVVTTGAHGGFDNIEVLEAKKKGIKVITKGEAVGIFMEGSFLGKKLTGISIAGSHGKTTTTAMIASILRENKMDPSYIAGTGEIPQLGNPGHFGKGNFFVAEADEYATEPKYDHTPQILWQHPKIAVFTNIDYDHPDIYKNVDEIRTAFLKFANQLPKDGILICCADDLQVKLLLKDFKGKKITYGFSPANDFILENVRVSGLQTFFWVKTEGVSLGQFSISIPGEHNALNALGAIITAQELGVGFEASKKAVAKFNGTKRRFELVGRLKSGALLYDDYAHHPNEIQNTLKAFKQSFPKHKLICVFQPHTYSRTKELFEQFSRSFTDADEVIFTDIFSSLREKSDPGVSSELLAQNTTKFNPHAIFLPKLEDVVKYIDQKNYGKDAVVISMGAGDVYKIGQMFK